MEPLGVAATPLGELQRLNQIRVNSGYQAFRDELSRLGHLAGFDGTNMDTFEHMYLGSLAVAVGGPPVAVAVTMLGNLKELGDLVYQLATDLADPELTEFQRAERFLDKLWDSATDIAHNHLAATLPTRLTLLQRPSTPAELHNLLKEMKDNGEVPLDGDDEPPNNGADANNGGVPDDENSPDLDPDHERKGEPKRLREEPSDPLVIDLDGDGIELIASDAGSAPYFDADNDGFLERVGWVGADDGLLVWDIDADGRITEAAELFGDSNGGPIGFAALALLDDNSDGAISAADAHFGELRVWQDADGDAVVDAGELQTLAAAGIQSISLTTTPQGTTVAGNTVTEQATITLSAGGTRTVSSVLFNVDQVDAIEDEDQSDIEWMTTLLPRIRGYGEMPSLWHAADGDSTLFDMVFEFSTAAFSDTPPDRAMFREQVEAIILRWTDSDGIATNSRGYGDARITSAVETFTGGPAAPWRSDGNLTEADYRDVQDVWNDFVAKIGIRLLIQGPLVLEFLPIGIDRIANTVAIIGDVEDAVEAFVNALAVPVDDGMSTADTQQAVAHWQFVVRMVDELVPEDLLVTRPYDTVLDDALGASGVPFDADSLRAHQIVAGAVGSGRAEILIGGGEVDTLQGGAGDDIYIGGLGNDTLVDSWGADTYLFADGDGADLIQDYGGTAWTDTLSFGPGITWAGVTLSRSGESLIIDAGGGDSVTIQDQFLADHRIEAVKFADGTTKTWLDIQERLLAEAQTSGDDTIVGFETDDTFDGGAGNDYAIGGWGADTYLVDIGDGADRINDYTGGGWTDVVTFGAGITWAGLSLARSGDTLTVGLGGGDSLTIEGQFDADHRIESFTFDGGTTRTWLDVQERLLAEAQTAGNDTIAGFETNDTFTNGAGNDRFVDTWGADSYAYALGDGADRIDDSGSTGDPDSVTFGAGIDWASSSWSRSGNDLMISFGGGDSLTIEGQFANAVDRIENFVFDGGLTKTWWDVQLRLAQTSGTSGNDTIWGFNTNDTLAGGAGNDSLLDGWGADTYLFAVGDGNDTIFEGGGGGDDTLAFGDGIDWNGISLGRVGNNLTIGYGSGDKVTVYDQFWRVDKQVDVLKFADGTTGSWLDIQQRLLAEAQTAGNDVISGFSTNDTFVGGAGDDTVYGGWGADLYVAASGDGNDRIYESGGGGSDTLSFGAGIDWSNIGLGRVGWDLAITYGSGDKITVVDNFWHVDRQMDVFKFEPGTSKTWLDVQLRLLSEAQTAGNDVIDGFKTNDTFDGGAGDDTVFDAWGADLYLAAAGDGHDRIYESGGGGSDTLSFGAGVDWNGISLGRAGNNLEIGYGSGDTITVVDHFAHPDKRMDVLKFEDGTTKGWADIEARAKVVVGTAADETIGGYSWNDTFYGGGGNDLLQGWDGNDTLAGGTGVDTLQGGNGADLFAYALGDGNDVIADFNYAAGDRVDLTDISYIGNGAIASIALLSADGGTTTYTISASNGYSWTGNEFV